MKARFLIYAYPHSYGGNHGMYDWEIVENYSYAEACIEGMELAREVIENYNIFDEDTWVEEYKRDCEIPEDADINWDYYFDWLDPLITEECEYEVYPLKDDADVEQIYHDTREIKEIIHDYCILQN